MFFLLVGAGLTIQHFRQNDTCPGGYEELKPIDENLSYDFDFQQYITFPQAVKVLPVSQIDITLCKSTILWLQLLTGFSRQYTPRCIILQNSTRVQGSNFKVWQVLCASCSTRNKSPEEVPTSFDGYVDASHVSCCSFSTMIVLPFLPQVFINKYSSLEVWDIFKVVLIALKVYIDSCLSILCILLACNTCTIHQGINMFVVSTDSAHTYTHTGQTSLYCSTLNGHFVHWLQCENEPIVSTYLYREILYC